MTDVPSPNPEFDLPAVATSIQRLNDRYTRAPVASDDAGGVKAFRTDTVRCYEGPDLDVGQGTYAMTYGPGDVIERGKYGNVWMQEDGAWKNHANIWNVSA